MGYTTTNGNIETNLRADIMRSSIENKNLLTSGHSIYVGAGEVNSNGTAITSEFKIENNNSLVFVSGTEMKSSTLLPNKSFLKTSVYDSLKLTWKSYAVQDSNFSSGETYSNLKLKNDNFSSDDKYSQISFQGSDVGVSVLIKNVGILSLREQNREQTLYFYPYPNNNFYCEKITIQINRTKIYLNFYTVNPQTINNLVNLYTYFPLLIGTNNSRRFRASGGSPTGDDYEQLERYLKGVFEVVQIADKTYRLYYYGQTTEVAADSDLTISSTFYKLV